MATKETELAILEPPEEERRPLTAVQIKAQVQLIQEVMGAVMQKDVHYGVIPGCEKPTLYKPGSEKLLSTFRIAVKPIETDLSTTEVVRYRVEARGTSMVDGRFLGSGIGECSSGEEKYAWRRVVCKEEWEATPADRRREKWAKKRNGEAYMMQQVLEVQHGFHWLDDAPRTLSGANHRPAYGADGNYFSKPNTESIFDTVYDMMRNSAPARFPALYKE